MQNSKISRGHYPGPPHLGERKVCFRQKCTKTLLQQCRIQKKIPEVEPRAPVFGKGMWKLPPLENMSGYATANSSTKLEPNHNIAELKLNLSLTSNIAQSRIKLNQIPKEIVHLQKTCLSEKVKFNWTC